MPTSSKLLRVLIACANLALEYVLTYWAVLIVAYLVLKATGLESHPLVGRSLSIMGAAVALWMYIKRHEWPEAAGTHETHGQAEAVEPCGPEKSKAVTILGIGLGIALFPIVISILADS